MNDKEQISEIIRKAMTSPSWSGGSWTINPDKTADAILEVLSTPEPEPSDNQGFWEQTISEAMSKASDRWDDDVAFVAIAERFVEHYSVLDAAIDEARAERDYDDDVPILFRWDAETMSLVRAVDPVEVTPEPSDKVIREFHGNNVWRDSEGVIWMRLDEAIEMRNLDTAAPEPEPSLSVIEAVTQLLDVTLSGTPGVSKALAEKLSSYGLLAVTPEPEPSDDSMDWTRLSNDALVSEGLAILDEECKDMSSAGLHLLHQYVYAVDAEHAVGVAQIHLEAKKSADSERQKVVNYLAGRASSVAPVEDAAATPEPSDDRKCMLCGHLTAEHVWAGCGVLGCACSVRNYEHETVLVAPVEVTRDELADVVYEVLFGQTISRQVADAIQEQFRVSRRDGEDKNND